MLSFQDLLLSVHQRVNALGLEISSALLRERFHFLLLLFLDLITNRLGSLVDSLAFQLVNLAGQRVLRAKVCLDELASLFVLGSFAILIHPQLELELVAPSL